jgi:8-oxo-dGTP diphosphatase
MDQTELRTIDVTCAIIVDDTGRVLTTQRSSAMSLPLKWEFPGGKIEPSESTEECLIREIKEELGIVIEIGTALQPNNHAYPAIVIKLIPFICKHISGKINLAEHSNYKWLNRNELLDLDWAEADVPIVYNYLNYLNAI